MNPQFARQYYKKPAYYQFGGISPFEQTVKVQDANNQAYYDRAVPMHNSNYRPSMSTDNLSVVGIESYPYPLQSNLFYRGVSPFTGSIYNADGSVDWTTLLAIIAVLVLLIILMNKIKSMNQIISGLLRTIDELKYQNSSGLSDIKKQQQEADERMRQAYAEQLLKQASEQN